MSRIITRNAVYAFESKRRFKKSNTEVRLVNGQPEMYLFGNKVAWMQNGRIHFTLCGWNTVTTRERLSALVGKITTKRGVPYWNGQEISSCGVYAL